MGADAAIAVCGVALAGGDAWAQRLRDVLGVDVQKLVNGKEVPPPVRQPLRPDDRIKICDFLFRFHDERVVKPKEIPDWMSKGDKEEEENENQSENSSEVEIEIAEPEEEPEAQREGLLTKLRDLLI